MTKHSSYKLTIKEHHLDTFGHINNATYISLFEEARWELIHQNGYGIETVHQKQLGPIILGIDVRFSAEVRYREDIEIVTDIINYKRKILKMSQKMLNENGDIACEAVLTAGLFDMRTRKLVLPTPEWLAALNLSPEEVDS